MKLEDFVVIFKGNLESVYVTFPFSTDSRKLMNFYDCKIHNLKDCTIISIEIINGTIILSLIYNSRY